MVKTSLRGLSRIVVLVIPAYFLMVLSIDTSFGQGPAPSTGKNPRAFIRVLSQSPTILPGHPTDPDGPTTFRKMQASLIKSPVLIRMALGSPQIKALPIVTEHPDPVRWLEEVLKVETVPDSEILTVSLSLPNSSQTAAIVNAVVDAYFVNVVEKEFHTRVERLEKLMLIREAHQQDLQKKREEIRQSSSELKDQGVVSEVKQGFEIQDIQENRKELRKLRLQKVATETRISQYKSAKAVPVAELTELATTLSILKAQEKILQQDEEKGLIILAKLSRPVVDLGVEQKAVATLEQMIGRLDDEIEILKANLQASRRIVKFQDAMPPVGQ